MGDIIFLGTIVVFFLLALGYIEACDSLRKGEQK